MPGQQITPVREVCDEVFTRTFGPLAAADTGTNGYARLPFIFDRDVIVTHVSVSASTLSSAASSVSLAQKSGAAPSGALSATSANRVTQGQLVNAAGLGAVNTVVSVPIHNAATPGVYNNNIVPAGTHLYLHSDVAATLLAGLLVHVRFTTRRN